MELCKSCVNRLTGECENDEEADTDVGRLLRQIFGSSSVVKLACSDYFPVTAKIGEHRYQIYSKETEEPA